MGYEYGKSKRPAAPVQIVRYPIVPPGGLPSMMPQPDPQESYARDQEIEEIAAELAWDDAQHAKAQNARRKSQWRRP